MLSHPHFSNKALAEFCHRLAVETEAGIDIRRSWHREAESARGRMRPAIDEVRDAVAKGESLSVALARTGQTFPPLFLEMVHVGEETGTLGQVFHRLSRHYGRQHKMERAFLAGIAWPMLQLVGAVIVIGILILVMGMIPQRGGDRLDPLGFGLIGVPGFIVYSIFIAVVAVCIAAVVVAMRRGVLWTQPLQRLVMKTPGLGAALEKIAIARLAWALHLMLNSALDFRRIVPLALRATGNDYYIQHTNSLVAAVTAGEPLHVAFSRTGAFPRDFIDALGVAEESGRTVESMERLSKRYEEESEAALGALTVLAGLVVWAFIAAIIIFLIFRLAGFYFSTINDALKATQ